MFQNKTPLVLMVLLLATTTPAFSLTPSAIAAEPDRAEFALPVAVPSDSTLRIDGSGTMSVINRLLKQRYEERFPGADVELDAKGTETALQELLNNEIDLAAIGRPLTADEKANGLKEISISQEKIAVIVGRNNPFEGALTVEQFGKIVRGEISDWSEVGGRPAAIRLIDRPASSDTRQALSQFGIAQGIPLIAAATAIRLDNDDTATVIRELGKDGISYAIASQLSSQDKARIVPIAVLQDTLPGDARYPYSQPRGYAYKGNPNAVAESFLGFALATPGQAAVVAAKTAEADAVVNPKAVAPKAKAKAKDFATAASEESNDRGFPWFWFLLPFVLLTLAFRWLRQRFASGTSTTPAAPAQEKRPTPATAIPKTAAEATIDNVTAPIAAAATIAATATEQAVEKVRDLIAIDPDHLYTQGVELAQSGRYAEAVPYFDGAVDAKADFLDAWLYKGNILIQLGRFDEAIASLDKAIELSSDQPDLAAAWTSKGSALARLGRSEAAIASFDRALEFDPEFADAWSGKGGALVRLGRADDAQGNFERAASLRQIAIEAAVAPTMDSDIPASGELTPAAKEAIAADVIQPADVPMESVVEPSIDSETIDSETIDIVESMPVASTPADLEAATASDLETDPVPAEPDMVTAHQFQPLYEQALFLVRSGQPSEALDLFDQAIDLQPDATDAWIEKGKILGVLGRYDDALPVFEQVLELQPNSVAALTGKGDTLISLGHSEEALPLFDRALELSPDAAPALTGKGNVLLFLGRFEEALPLFERAIEVEPNPATLTGKGSALLKLGRSEEALLLFEQAIALNPEFPEALTGKGNTLVSLGRTEEAQSLFNQVAQFAGMRSVEPLPEVAIAATALTPAEAALARTPAVETPVAVGYRLGIPTDLRVGDLPGDAASDLTQAVMEALSGKGKSADAAPMDYYLALASVMCDRLLHLNTPEALLNRADFRLVGEVSAEYMPGPHLQNSLVNSGYLPAMQAIAQEAGIDLQTLFDLEEEPGLGRGGLGRLMVCYLDSLATTNIPAIGYGIRYELGIFDQEIQDGWQVEVPDTWLQHGNPWEFERPDGTVEVKLGGHTEAYVDEQGRYRVRWIAQDTIKGILYDTPIPGYRTNTVNLLRLWKAESAESGNLCKVLYPVDIESQGRELRLKQQFFLVSCALQDILRMHRQANRPIEALPERFALQLNDTDTTLAVAELMRLLLDEHGVEWEHAWGITQQTLAYTNHSLMPETLDDLWSIGALGCVLPRHLEIIFEINTRFLNKVQGQYPNDLDRLRRLSLIDETGERHVRLNNLACVGSHAINGVSVLHTNLLEQRILPDFYELYPGKFSNKTNGVTPRRFLLMSNPPLADLITRHVGDGWVKNLELLNRLEGLANEPEFCQDWQRVKQTAKQAIASYIHQTQGMAIDPHSLFDVQAMVMHEYKRQHLNVLHILTLYNRIKADPSVEILPRTFIFSGKAAPDYFTAKLMIKLITNVAAVINSDADVGDRLKVVFLPDFTTKLTERIYPAIDLAEHLSTAGTEASDTGNMIAALNGGLIIGTPDGSNIEIRDAIGADNFFEFGRTAEGIDDLRANNYNPSQLYYTHPVLKEVIDLLVSGTLSHGDTELFRPLYNLLPFYDQYLLLADYQSYIDTQEQVNQCYRDPQQWTRKSILSTARIGRVSSDRAVREYCQEIWHVKPMTESSQYVQA